jgi:phosphoribosyl 1,2-cyclic phosphodiesterase
VQVKFWGTRGSLPVGVNHQKALALIEELTVQAQKMGVERLRDFTENLKSGKLGLPLLFGGNTTCTEVVHESSSLFIDMGSGLREAGTQAMQQGIKEFSILMTHMHWDHVMGMPFFIPVHVPGHKINIYHVHKNAPEYIKINFNGVNFPLTWDQLRGQVVFHQVKLYQTTEIGTLKFTPFVLDHPGGSFGYRIEAGGKSCAIGVDSEYKRLSREELGKDLPFYQNLDMLLFDAQYEMSELATRFDWGHCSPNIGVDLALREKIKCLIFTHHDPWSGEDKLRRMHANATNYLKSQFDAFSKEWESIQAGGPTLKMAYDGLTVTL